MTTTRDPSDEAAATGDQAPEGETPSEAEQSAAEDGPSGLVSPRVACALSVLGGALYVVALPGIGLWPAAFVAQAPFYLALYRQPPRRAALIGLLNGFTFSVGGFHWLYGTLQRFGGLPGAAAFAVLLLMCAYQGGRATITGWLTARAAERGWPAPAVFVLALAAGEQLYPLLFPWYFAVAIIEAPLFVQVADVGGPVLVGALLTGSSLAVAEIVRARIARDRASRVVIAAGLAATALSGVYGAVRIRQVEATTAAAPALQVGVAQGNLPLIGRHEGARVHRRLTRELRDQGAELVVWSEGSVSDVYDEETYREDTRRRISARLGVPTLIGGGVKSGQGAQYRELNTALFTDESGEVIGRYDKHYLLPFGEYMPFGKTFPQLYKYSPHSGRMSPGESIDPVILDGHPITVIICYEDLLPAFVNDAVRRAKAELIVNMTIDTWFGDSIEPWEHLGLAQIRAVEHRRFLVRATNSGVSAIVDAAGRITKHGAMFKEDSFVGEVKLMAPRTIYEIIGDVPLWIGVAIAFAMAFVRRPENLNSAKRNS